MSRLIDVAAILDGMAKTLAGTEQGEACAFAVRIMRERESAAPALHPDTERLDAIEDGGLDVFESHGEWYVGAAEPCRTLRAAIDQARAAK